MAPKPSKALGMRLTRFDTQAITDFQTNDQPYEEFDSY
jgi:hypothetical protein